MIARTTSAGSSCACLLALLWVGACPVAASAVTFSKIADTSTPAPGGSGNFSAFSVSLGATGREDFIPSIHEGDVAFLGVDAAFDFGVYKHTGALHVVANQGTAIPDGTGNFTGFRDPSINAGQVAFVGFGPSTNNTPVESTFQQGVYTDLGGLNRMADRTTAMPGFATNFKSFGGVRLDGGGVSFVGQGPQGSDNVGIYTTLGGGLTTVVDRTDPVPNDPFNEFEGFSHPGVDAGGFAFTNGFFEGSGIYTDLGGGLAVVADRTTPVPGGVGTFEFFRPPSLDAGDVAFTAGTFAGGPSGKQMGLYSTIGGLNALADLNTPIPGGVGNFTLFDAPVLEDGNVAFFGGGALQGGIYLYTGFDGMIKEIIASGDTLDSKTVLTLGFGPEGFSDGSVAFFVRFDDFSEAIYRADLGSLSAPVPEPTTVALLALGLAGLSLARRRRWAR